MTDDKNPQDRDDLEEGAYTDVETEKGRDVHEKDAEEGEYTDVDRGDGTTS